jgi:hypothetical protein
MQLYATAGSGSEDFAMNIQYGGVYPFGDGFLDLVETFGNLPR